LRRVAFTATLLVPLSAGACRSSGDAIGPDTPDRPRTWAMGWAPIAPRADVPLVLAVMDSLSKVSDIAILQQPVPWPELLAGASLDSLIEDRNNVAAFLRAKGLDIIFLVDPLDGLDRRREDPGLVAAGRSILEPSIRALHEEWVRRIAARVRPEYLGLASEINTLAARGDPALYAEIRDVVNTLAPEVRQRSPATQVFVSFQVDEANGALGQDTIDHFALIDDFDIDALGLSSYPVFAFDSPADIPDDYFQKFRDATDLPLLLVEGGWSSADVPWSHGTPEQQVEFIDRFETLLDGVQAEAWVMLTFTDLDVNGFGLDPDRAAGLSNFAHMGILDTALRRKPAYAAWQRVFDRPLAR
jgi:hypothetical protein